jgi:Phosphotransferase enzyme family
VTVDEEARRWIEEFVQPTGPMQVYNEEPWATVVRIPIAGEDTCWFKRCAPIQAFEPRLTGELFVRWPDRVTEVIAHDVDRSWLLLADAGESLEANGNPPEAWLHVLPTYAELQRGEAVQAADHVAHGVPDLRLASLPARFEELLSRELPLDGEDVERLRAVGPRFERSCDELAAFDVPETIQHDDLHMRNVYEKDGAFRVLDWGDSCVSHPFFSLVETFRFLEEVNRLPAGDPWFSRLSDVYLQVWQPEARSALPVALTVGAVAHAIAWMRQRDALPPDALPMFDVWFAVVLRRALAQVSGVVR